MTRLTGFRLWIGLGVLSAAAMVGAASMLTHGPIGPTVATAHRAAPLAPAVAEPRIVTAQPVTAEPAPANAAPSAPQAVPQQSAPFASTTVPVAAAPAAQEQVSPADRCSAMTGGGRGHPVPLCVPLAPQP